MGGTVDVTSTPGAGSTFRFSFLAEEPRQAPAEPVPANASSGPDNPNLLSGLRILVADDNRVNRLVVQMFLKRYGVVVTEAVNGREALDALGGDVFDVVLMDVHMPVMDGVEATVALRASGESWSDIPVIALTADVLAGDRDRFLAAGFTDQLPKPVVEADLVEALRRAASLARPDDARAAAAFGSAA